MAVSGKTLLITGIPGIGKTTIVKQVAASLPGYVIGGFYTEAIVLNNRRQGFELVTLQGERLVMAHVENNSFFRVGRYGVDVPALDRCVAMTLPEEGPAELYIIDEIGKMECFSGLFVAKISALLDGGTPLVATIAKKGGGFIAGVKNRPDIELWEVTKQNRNAMPGKILAWIAAVFKKNRE